MAFCLYNLVLHLLFFLASPVLVLFCLLDLFHMRERLGLREPSAIDSRASILLHGASLGEMGVLGKILPAVRTKYPGRPIIVSSATVSGKDYAQKTLARDISHAVLFPAEMPFAVRRVLRNARPELVIIAETELWPNFVREVKRRGARLVLINGRLSDRAYPKYLRFRRLFGGTLRAFDAVGAQNPEYLGRFRSLGADPARLTMTGNVKEALVPVETSGADKRSLRVSLGFGADDPVWIAASTRPGEEAVVLEAFLSLTGVHPRLRLVLAPRHPKRAPEIEALLQSLSIDYQKKSALTGSTHPVLLLDTLGELSGLFAAASVAFVGGTLMPFGGHNLLEPLPHRVPVCFGPFIDTQKQSARFILQNRCGVQAEGAAALSAFVNAVLARSGYAGELSENIARAIALSGEGLRATIALI
ncbi:MAG: glycosyltransferase N-terminal domain-containing protein [Fibrobacterota bacterium]